MKKNSKKTIIDIARASGVSVSTVSRILNGKPDVAEETRNRVLQIIEENRYTPQAQWQQIASGRSRTICMHYPLSHATFGQISLEFVIGATMACEENNYFLNLATKPLNEASLLKLYRSGQIDGMILMEVHTNDWRVDFLHENQLPFIMIGHTDKNSGVSFVDMDFESTVILAVDYLYSLGHREISFISITPHTHQKTYGPSVRSLEGYEKARSRYGLKNLFQEVHGDFRDVEKVCRNLLSSNPKISAIIAVNSTALLGVLHAVQEHGLQVPEDISVMALAPDPLAQFTSPPLTTIQFPSRSMGYEACKMLINRLEGKSSEEKQILIPAELMVRSSTGPANSR